MRVLGWLAMVVAVIGIVACLGVAVGAWVVKPQALERVDEIVAILDDGVTKSTTLIDNVGVRLTNMSTTLGDLQARVTAVATSPLVDSAVAGAIKGAVANLISGPYTDLKNSTAELRGQVNSLGSVLSRLDQAIPFISLPGTISNGIGQLDQTLTTADNAISGLDTLLTSEQTTSEQITAVGTRIGELQAQLDAFNGALATVRTDIDGLHPKVGETQDTVHRLTDWAVLGGSLFFLYVALLQVLLFRQGRNWARARSQA